jgi:ketosteroid isomerase-like protein
MASLYIEHPEMKDPTLGTKTVKMTQMEIIKKYEELGQMIPDVRDSVIQYYSAKDNLIVEFISKGTDPTRSQFELPISTIFEIKDGKITKDFTYFDNQP